MVQSEQFEMGKRTADAIRVLSAEAIDKAKSGHPGLPLGCASIGYLLYARHLKHNPKNPNFFNRDRFILSAGHGSMLLYSLLHIFGYDVSIEDIKNFRQLGSRTPGHPEVGHTPGVETSTGPLGQGVANAVGFAVAETMLAARFNKPDLKPIDHYTYVLCGDGCMMEGIESEAASLAGTWKLGKLIVIYDANKITIEGDTDQAFTENVAKRHEAQGWEVIHVRSGEDYVSINRAISKAKKNLNKPSLVIINTKIGHGSAKEGSADCHGAPLGASVTEEMKRNLGFGDYPPFTVPEEVYRHTRGMARRFADYERAWNRLMREYKEKYPEDYAELNKWISGENKSAPLLTEDIWVKSPKADATRNSSGIMLNMLADLYPNLVGGAADLAPSTKTYLKDKGDYSATNRGGRNIHFGIREHAMSAICNGIQLHGGLYAYCSTFFVFSDYMKNAMRMSALMNLPVIYVLTHDSIGVGEDGPTHEPIEQLASLRTMPNINVYRPADMRETVAAYVSAMRANCPTAIVCSRQNLPQLVTSGHSALKGGYIASDSTIDNEMLLIATGSEVGVALEVQKMLLERDGIGARVVSMPCCEVFDKQDESYRNEILPPQIKTRISIEAGSTLTWHKYVGSYGKTIGIDTFGASAPADVLFEKYGLTPEKVYEEAKVLYKKNSLL